MIDRGRKEVSKLGERWLGIASGEMSDHAFIGHIERTRRRGSAEATAASIFDRIRTSIGGSSSFIPSLSRCGEIVSMMEDRYGCERRLILDRADRAIEGRFDLLGFSDLRLGAPPDWLLEPMSGKRSPLDHWSKINYLDPASVGDKKVTWELNRHQHFVTLGQAYWMTGDERYSEAFVAQAVSWMDANPPKRGINWTSSLELAFRAISWSWSLQMFAGSPCLTDKVVLRFLKYLLAHGLHIQSNLSNYFSPNTHLTGEALSLVYLGTAFKEFKWARAWRELGVQILHRELSRQIRSDGVYFEQTTAYHRYTADFYIHLLLLARAGATDLPPNVESALSQLLTHLVWVTRPDRSTPLVGDEDGGRLIVLNPRKADDFRDTIAIGATLFGRGEWKRAAGECPVELLWLLGPEGIASYDALHPETPRTSSRVFQAGGYAVLRDGWSEQSTYALMDCGPHGSLSCGHSHADALSIEFAAVGENWIVDPGTFIYTGDREQRDWFRSTAAHSTATVDGASQSIPAGVFRWNHIATTSLAEFVIGEGFDYIEASHDGYERLTDPVTHTRQLMFAKSINDGDNAGSLPSYLIVRDSFVASRRHKYAIRYQLAPACAASVTGNRVNVTGPGGGRLTIVAFNNAGSGVKLCSQITQGWVSRAYGKREAAPVVVFEFEAEGPQQFTTFIIPYFDGRPVCIEQPMDSGDAFQVVANGRRDVLLLGTGKEPVSWGPLKARAAVAWSCFEDGEFSRAFLMHGMELETDVFRFRSAQPINHCTINRAVNGLECSINGGGRFFFACDTGRKKVVVGGMSFEISANATDAEFLEVIN